MGVCGGAVADIPLPPVPLRSSSVSMLIRGFVADVGCELLYRNEEPGPVEAVFKFPVDAEAAVYAFEAWLSGACIQAQLHEKKQAQELYGDALAGGQSLFLLQQEGAGGDMFSCSLANLPPGEEAVLPTVLRPRYTPHWWDGQDVTQGVLWVPQRELPYTLSLSATLQSPHGITRVLSNCPLTPLSYTAGNRTTAQERAHLDDVELLVYYAEPHKPNMVLEAGLPGAKPGSLMGDPAVMVTLLPRVPEVVPAQSRAWEFILLLDCSGSMACPMDSRDLFRQRINSAKETLILLLKSLPLGCYFNIYGFGSEFESFYLQSMEYTQLTMAESLQGVQLLQANLGGTKFLEPLQAIYRSPCRDGHPHQLFVFTDGEAENTQDVITEVWRHQGTHRCFSFGIGDGVSTALIKGIARAADGSAEFITGQDRMQPKVRTQESGLPAPLDRTQEFWHPLPPFIPLDPAPLPTAAGTQASRADPMTLSPQHRLPVYRLAAKSLLLELEGAVGAGSEVARHRAVETSLSLGVICSLTAYVGVNMERGQLVQGLLVRWDVPLAAPSGLFPERAPEESALLRLVSLQNADSSWDLDPRLLSFSCLPQDMTPSIWAMVLAVVWLHDRAMGQRDEWELLEAKAVGWVECLEAANTLLDCSVGPAVFGL
uniref:von Willebrand factor A domain-containing protein 5A n=1 Tax=Gopherus evgoodei TaxID=1825980 RepID=A0A8C4YR47_9SAUR